MTRVRPIEIIRFFYSTSLDHIPLVRDLDSRLEGYLSRERLNRELSDLERASQEFESIPEDWIAPDVSREELLRLASQCPVPVLNRAGQEKISWQETELLRHASELKERRAREAEESQQDAEADRILDASPESSDQWFARLVLAAIPHPIFATDLNGHSLFYNEGFQHRVLKRDFFHNNLALAEAYFLELTRGLLARVYSEGPHPADLLFASIPELSISVEITTIHREDSISGYLYIFQDPELSGIPHEVLSRLERGMSLDEIMEELEAGIIASMLRRNGQNISHAAQALRINRSTLQNKIKRLNVNERFARKVDGPVRRVRPTRSESADTAEDGDANHPQASDGTPRSSSPALAPERKSTKGSKAARDAKAVPAGKRTAAKKVAKAKEPNSKKKSTAKSGKAKANPSPKQSKVAATKKATGEGSTRAAAAGKGSGTGKTTAKKGAARRKGSESSSANDEKRSRKEVGPSSVRKGSSSKKSPSDTAG